MVSHHGHSWTFFTNHGHVVVCLASRPGAPLREVAGAVGMAGRAVQGIVRDLESAGILQRRKQGRTIHDALRLRAPLRHPPDAHRTVGDILAAVHRGPVPPGWVQ